MTEPQRTSRSLYLGPFLSLETKLSDCVRDLQQNDALAEAWVIIPNQLTRQHLQRRLAESRGIHANVRFLTLQELAHLLAEPVVLQEGWKLLGEAATDPLVKKIVTQELTSLEYFGRVAESGGFRRAFLRTRRELLLNGISAAKLGQADATSREASQKLRELTLLMNAFDRELARLRWHDSAVLLQLALRAVRQRPPTLPPLFLYGLHDVPPLIRRVLAALLSREPVRAFLPGHANDARYDFLAPLRSWYDSQGFEFVTLQSAVSPEYRFVLAPDHARVAAEIVRDMLFPPEACAGDLAIVLPSSSDKFAFMVSSRCREAGLEPYIYEARSLGETHAGRGLSALAKLLGSEFELRYLRDYLLNTPFNAEPAALAAEWNRIAQEAGIVQGRTQWPIQLARVVEHLRWRRDKLAEQEESDESADALTVIVRQIAVAERFLEFVTALLDLTKTIETAANWESAVAALWRYYSTTALIDEEFADLVAQLQQASQLDQAGIPFDVAGLQNFIEATLTTPGSRTGKYPRNLPIIATREQCYGVTFAAAFHPGYNEGVLPRAESQDPLLLDADRVAVGQALHVQLPLRRDWQERELFWFAVAQDSARQLFVYAASADDEGRPRLLSHYLLRLLEQQCGAGSDRLPPAELYGSHPRCRYVSAHPLPERGTKLISEAEYRRATLRSALRERSSAPLAHLWQSPEFARRIEAETKRFSERAFSSFDGLLSAPETRRRLSEKFAPTVSLSATTLESYWRCPFRFAIQHELEAYAPEQRGLLDPPDARALGTLLHAILQKYHEPRIGRPLTPENFEWEPLAELARQLSVEFERRSTLSPAYLRERNRAMLLELLRSYYAMLMIESAAWHTRDVEVSFGQKQGRFPDPLEVRGAAGEFARFKGRIDRWDEDAGGRQLRLLDYKSGKLPGKDSRGAQRRLQLEIYRQLALQSAPHASVISRYQYLRDGKHQDDDGAQDNAALQVVFNLLADLRNGVFVPDPAEDDSYACANCEMKLACGAQRHARKQLNTETILGLRTTRGEQDRDSASEASDSRE